MLDLFIFDVVFGKEEAAVRIGLGLLCLLLAPLFLAYHYFMIKHHMRVPKSIVDFYLGSIEKIQTAIDSYTDADLIVLHELAHSKGQADLRSSSAHELLKRELIDPANIQNHSSLYMFSGMLNGMQPAHLSDRFIICGGTNVKDTLLIKLCNITSVDIARVPSVTMKQQDAFKIQYKNKSFKETALIVPDNISSWREIFERNNLCISVPSTA